MVFLVLLVGLGIRITTLALKIELLVKYSPTPIEIDKEYTLVDPSIPVPQPAPVIQYVDRLVYFPVTVYELSQTLETDPAGGSSTEPFNRQ